MVLKSKKHSLEHPSQKCIFFLVNKHHQMQHRKYHRDFHECWHFQYTFLLRFQQPFQTFQKSDNGLRFLLQDEEMDASSPTYPPRVVVLLDSNHLPQWHLSSLLSVQQGPIVITGLKSDIVWPSSFEPFLPRGIKQRRLVVILLTTRRFVHHNHQGKVECVAFVRVNNEDLDSNRATRVERLE